MPDEPLDPYAPPRDLDADEAERPIGEECGVFGVWAPDEDVAKLTYYGLYALQHRGQEAAGIAVSRRQRGARLQGPRPGRAGLRRGDRCRACAGHLAIGHTRYSTTGAGTWENAQPSFRTLSTGGSLALGHNGNLINTAELARLVADLVPRRRPDGRHHRLRPHHRRCSAARPDVSPDAAALRGAADPAGRVLPGVHGRAHAVRGARPARRPPARARAPRRGWVVASETAALDIVGASFVREVEPGELLAIDEHGRAHAPASPTPTPKGCLFEYVYLARPDTAIAGQSVYTTRVRSAARSPSRPPPTPTSSSRCPSPGRRRRSASPSRAASRTAWGWSRTPTSAAPSSSRPRRSASSASGSSSTRCATVDQGQAAGRRRRLDRARQHPAGARAHAARGRRRRGARADLQPAGDVAVLLRHRLRQPRRAHRLRHGRRGDPLLDRRRLARARLARGPDGRERAAGRPAVPGLLRRRLPDRDPRPEVTGQHVPEGLQRVAVAGHASPAEHEHTPAGITVFHNGVASVDRMDALLPSAEEVPS